MYALEVSATADRVGPDLAVDGDLILLEVPKGEDPVALQLAAVQDTRLALFATSGRGPDRMPMP